MKHRVECKLNRSGYETSCRKYWRVLQVAPLSDLYQAVFVTFFDGYCSTVQGLLDWFEVDLGFTELSFSK